MHRFIFICFFCYFMYMVLITQSSFLIHCVNCLLSTTAFHFPKHYPHPRSTCRSMKTSLSSDTMKTYKIFYYGDSFTAGTSPPDFKEYPYAQHLESTLNKLYSSSHNKYSNNLKSQNTTS